MKPYSRYLLIGALILMVGVWYNRKSVQSRTAELQAERDFFKLCLLFHSDLPAGTAPITSQAFRLDPAENHGDDSYHRYAVVYQYSGSKKAFARAMMQHIDKMKFPMATHVAEYFPDEPPIVKDDGYGVFLAAQTSAEWLKIKRALTKPKTCLVTFTLPDEVDLKYYVPYVPDESEISLEDSRGRTF